MKNSIFETVCPCCGAVLEIDPETKCVLFHTPSKPKSAPEDLGEAVRKLKSHEQGREKRFQAGVEAERLHKRALENKFAGLLDKSRDEPPGKPFLRDIDLD